MKTKVESLTLSGIRQFSARYEHAEDMVFLTIGEPDFNTPEPIKEAVYHALAENHTHYPPAMGDGGLRKAVAKHESKLSPSILDEDQVIITNGATEGLVLALWTSVDPGDEVVIVTPCFPLYMTQVALVGAKAVTLSTEDTGFQFTKEMLESVVTPRTKALLITSPNNPTGTLYNEASNQAIWSVMRANPEMVVIVDEVYRSMVFEGVYHSVRDDASLSDRIIVVESFSKSHAMTGWRVGYVVASQARIDLMHRLHQNLVTGVSTFSQKACIDALACDNRYMMESYALRRAYVLKRLDAMALSYTRPDGAFFVFPSIQEFGLDSELFCTRLAEEAGLVLIPGIYFGAEGHVRISYGCALDVLEKGMDRLEGFITKIRP